MKIDKISVSNIIDFKREYKTPFTQQLKGTKGKTVAEEDENYWISSLRTIAQDFRYDNKKIIAEKIQTLTEAVAKNTDKASKDKYLKNIEVLHNFEDFDFSKYKPANGLQLLSKKKSNAIISEANLPIEVLPQHVFSYKHNKTNYVGAVWFISKLDGYTIDEIAIFTDTLYRFLSKVYSSEFTIEPKFCTAIDTVSLQSVNYRQIEEFEVASSLDSILTELYHKL